MSPRARRVFVLSVALFAAAPLIRAVAQDQDPQDQQQQPGNEPQLNDRLSIRTRALLTAPADEVELELAVQGSAEEARDAEKKHRARLKRVMAALTGQEIKADPADDEDAETKKPKRKAKTAADEVDDAPPAVGVPDEDGVVYEVREGRYTVVLKGAVQANDDDDDDFRPRQQVHQDPEARVCSAVHVTFKNIAKASPKKIRRLIARTIDRAAAAGADVGPAKTRIKPTIRFRVTALEELKRRAYAEAIAKGRARAVDLAKLANRELGKLSVVSDVQASEMAEQKEAERSGNEQLVAALVPVDSATADAFSVASELSVEVFLELDFDLVK
jgi:uncharacterized protein YggE